MHFFKFPTEWDSGTIDARWGWLKTQSTENPTPMSATDFEQLRAHITALAFWPGGTLLDSNHWHFEPRQFIKQFKKCGWLKRDEMKQMVPSYAIRNAGSKGILWEQIPLVLAATGAFARQQVPLNKMLRKYGIRGEQRLSSFFGNAIQETAWFVAAPRYRNQIHENNTAERYFPWDGRGFLQLTWSDNYINYWDYLGRSNQISAAVRTALHNAQVKVNTKPRSSAAYATADTVIPQVLKDWRNDVADPDGTDAAGSAGYYWAKLNMASYADAPHQLERVSVNTNAGNHTYYRSPSFWRASAAVNLPAAINTLYSHSLNGFEQRCSVYSVVLAIAGDDVRLFASANGTQLDFPEGMQPRR